MCDIIASSIFLRCKIEDCFVYFKCLFLEFKSISSNLTLYSSFSASLIPAGNGGRFEFTQKIHAPGLVKEQFCDAVLRIPDTGIVQFIGFCDFNSLKVICQSLILISLDLLKKLGLVDKSLVCIEISRDRSISGYIDNITVSFSNNKGYSGYAATGFFIIFTELLISTASSRHLRNRSIAFS